MRPESGQVPLQINSEEGTFQTFKRNLPHIKLFFIHLAVGNKVLI